ncbi:VRR-NUC domain protein [Vibrio phage LP.1]|nr:VRR-NUC domain protein [Vibrio phage LP.1]
MKISESNIELNVNRHAAATGWLSFKFNSANHAGVPDRIYIRDGVTIYIEFKATGQKPRKLQEITFDKMRAHGAKVFVVDSIEDGKAVLDAN